MKFNHATYDWPSNNELFAKDLSPTLHIVTETIGSAHFSLTAEIISCKNRQQFL